MRSTSKNHLTRLNETRSEQQGYGLRGADQGQPHLWALTMAVQFTTTDRRYQWLNTTLGVVVSEFDERTGRARWQAFVP